MNVSDGLRSRLPILSWAPRYRRRWFGGDLLAGLVVAALAVPQALGYAGIAGVPVVVGIYAIPAALIAYAIFGSSPHLVVGPVSTVSVVSGSIVVPMAAGDTDRALALTAALAIGAGLGLLAVGLLRLGWAAEFLSRPIVTGFVFGLVLVIIIGEIPKLFGLPPVSGNSIAQSIQLVRSITQLDTPTTLLGVCALAVLFLGARFAPRVPWGLLVLIAAIVISSAADLSDRGVVVVGEVPKGLPPIGLPGIELDDIAPVVFGGLAMAMVALAEGLSAARLFAAKEGYSIDSNQELVGSGAANIAAGISGGLGVAGSLSKTAASRRSGGQTQVTGLITAIIVVLVLVLLAELLAPLPRAVLSAIVIQAVWGLMDTAALKRYRGIRRNDFVSAIAAMIGVLLFGPLYGLLIAIGQALLGLVYRFSRIDFEVMGRVPDEKAAWGSIRNHPERRTYDGIVVSPTGCAAVLGQCGRRMRRGPGLRSGGRRRCPRSAVGPGGDQPTGHHQHRRARTAAPTAPGPRHRPLPGAGVLSGQADAGARRLHRTARRGAHVAQHLGRGAGGPQGGRTARSRASTMGHGVRRWRGRCICRRVCRAHSRGAQWPRRLRGPRRSKKSLVALELRAR